VVINISAELRCHAVEILASSEHREIDPFTLRLSACTDYPTKGNVKESHITHELKSDIFLQIRETNLYIKFLSRHSLQV
jgi:hypothetical protein